MLTVIGNNQTYLLTFYCSFLLINSAYYYTDSPNIMTIRYTLIGGTITQTKSWYQTARTCYENQFIPVIYVLTLNNPKTIDFSI